MAGYSYDTLSSHDPFAIDAAQEERAWFIRKTYLNLAGAIGLFAGLETLFLTNDALKIGMLELIGGHWWVALLAFMGVSWLASHWANSGASPAVQYAGLGLYAVAEALIFVPLLTIASAMSPDIVPSAGLVTLVIFGGLTGIVFLTKADFSFLGGTLTILSFGALAVALCGMLFGFSLGIFFAGAMVALMAGWILYDTSNILHHYRTDQSAAAALALFSSLATLFWYVIRLFMAAQSDD